MATIRDEVLGLVRATTDRSTVLARGTQRSPGEPRTPMAGTPADK